MHKVVSIDILSGHRLNVLFDDGRQGCIALADRLFGPMFEPLREEEFFRQATIDEFGVICWPNGADLAPDALYERVGKAAHQDAAQFVQPK